MQYLFKFILEEYLNYNLVKIKTTYFNLFLFLCALLLTLSSFGLIFTNWDNDFESIEYNIQPKSILQVNGKTNINSFCCASQERFGNNNLDYKFQEQNFSFYFQNTRFDLNIKELDCGKKKINRDLFKALKVNEYPNISIVLNEALNIECTDMSICGEWTDFEVSTDITITCETRRIMIPILVKRLEEHSFRITGGTSLKLCDFAVKAPTALLGLIKVKDEIDFNFDLYVNVI